MNMYAIYLDIWIFGSHRSRNKIWTKSSLSGHGDFFPNLDKKITCFKIWKGFGGDLEHPDIWIFEHLSRYMNYGSHPVRNTSQNIRQDKLYLINRILCACMSVHCPFGTMRSAIWSIFDIVLSTVWPAKSGTVLHKMPPTIT